MRKAMQLKSRIKNLALKNKIPAQAVLQNFIMEGWETKVRLDQFKTCRFDPFLALLWSWSDIQRGTSRSRWIIIPMDNADLSTPGKDSICLGQYFQWIFGM